MSYPRLEIDCTKISHNAKTLNYQLALKGISITPVTKVCLGHPVIAKMLVSSGAEMLADSRVENIVNMKKAGINLPIMLIRSPMLSQVSDVVQYCDISLNTELSVIQHLSTVASELNIIHGVIIMVELGDLREGVMPDDLMALIGNIVQLPNIALKGIGANLACRYGISPDDNNMSKLSDLADEIENKFDVHLEVISGGNSASLNWALNNMSKTRVNNLRVGEAIFLGCDPLYQEPIKGLFCDAITLIAEVIESKVKPSIPWGERGVNAFGEKPVLIDKGDVSQAIIAIGRQDISITGIKPPSGIKVVASTSDHLIVETSGQRLSVGQKVKFSLDYGALLTAMSSPFIDKIFLESKTQYD